MDENKMIGIAFYTSTSASLYEMLAEEASELSTAASKYARYLRDDQPLGKEWTPLMRGTRLNISCVGIIKMVWKILRKRKFTLMS